MSASERERERERERGCSGDSISSSIEETDLRRRVRDRGARVSKNRCVDSMCDRSYVLSYLRTSSLLMMTPSLSTVLGEDD